MFLRFWNGILVHFHCELSLVLYKGTFNSNDLKYAENAALSTVLYMQLFPKKIQSSFPILGKNPMYSVLEWPLAMKDTLSSEGNFTLADFNKEDGDGVNVAGLVSIVLFYSIVLAIGVWAGWQQRKAGAKADQETVMLAGRNLGLFVGILTMGGRTSFL